MNSAALIFSVWEDFSDCFQHAQTFVAYDQLHPFKPASFQPLQEVNSACLVLFHAFGSTQNLAVPILIHRNSYKNWHILVLSAPVTPQVDTVQINIRISAALQGTVSPILYVDVGLCVQQADCCSRYLAASQCFGNILYAAYGYAGEVHLDQRFLNAAFPAAIEFDDRHLKRCSL